MKAPLYINEQTKAIEAEVYVIGQRLAIEIPAGAVLPKPFKESVLSLHLSVEQWKLLAEIAATPWITPR